MGSLRGTVLAAWPCSVMAHRAELMCCPGEGVCSHHGDGKLPPCWVFGCFAVPDSFRAFGWWSHNTDAAVHREQGFPPFLLHHVQEV